MALIYATSSINIILGQSIACGSQHSIFLCSTGDPKSCGLNGKGQLGNGSTVDNSTVVSVGTLSGITAVEGGFEHSLFLKNDGTVWASGYNISGQLGDGTTTDRSSPVQVSGLSGITGIAAGRNHSVFLKNDGTVWACGYNGSGQLGDGTTTTRTTPVQINGLNGIVAVAAGGMPTQGDFSLFLKNDGTVWATGYNNFGALGDGTTAEKHSPVQVNTVSGIVAIAAGAMHSLFLKNDGTVWACGYNASGQLGNGTFANAITPVQTIGAANIISLAAGDGHSLFLKNDGTVWACGANFSGQLGDLTTTTQSTLVQSTSLSGVATIAAGSQHSLFQKNDGTVWFCGSNAYGQGGTGVVNPNAQSTAIVVSNLCVVTAIDNVFLENKISIYPNPFTEHATLESDMYLENVSISILSSYGQTLKSIPEISGNIISLNRENLPPGVYFLKISLKNNTLTKKLIIAD